jgi:hypothetical protein
MNFEGHGIKPHWGHAKQKRIISSNFSGREQKRILFNNFSNAKQKRMKRCGK